MPVYLRIFYIKRLNDLFKTQKKEHEKAMRQAKTRSKSTPKAKPPKMKRR